MILPTKHLPLEKSALGTAAVVLGLVGTRSTVSEAWERASADGIVETFDQLVAGIDLLYLMGILDYADGWLVRTRDS